jgi:hypothetical protein
MDEWRTGQVMVELATRERNEWIAGESRRFGTAEGLVDYACECSSDGCPSLISLTLAEYEGVRRNGTHFAIARDHENPVIDALLAEAVRFSTVSKVGEGGRMASEADPRRSRET